MTFLPTAHTSLRRVGRRPLPPLKAKGRPCDAHDIPDTKGAVCPICHAQRALGRRT